MNCVVVRRHHRLFDIQAYITDNQFLLRRPPFVLLFHEQILRQVHCFQVLLNLIDCYQMLIATDYYDSMKKA